MFICESDSDNDFFKDIRAPLEHLKFQDGDNPQCARHCGHDEKKEPLQQATLPKDWSGKRCLLHPELRWKLQHNQCQGGQA